MSERLDSTNAITSHFDALAMERPRIHMVGGEPDIHTCPAQTPVVADVRRMQQPEQRLSRHDCLPDVASDSALMWLRSLPRSSFAITRQS
jgi:hypothetical protein